MNLSMCLRACSIAMRVFVHYKEGSETDLHKTLKLTIPKKWLDKSPTKVLDLFIESYNARLVLTW